MLAAEWRALQWEIQKKTLLNSYLLQSHGQEVFLPVA